MNRQTKRQMERSGADKRPRAPERTRRGPTPAAAGKERVGPRQFFSEVRGELRKVAWPDRDEVVNSTIVVIIAVIFMAALIFAFDYGSAKFVLFLFD